MARIRRIDEGERIHSLLDGLADLMKNAFRVVSKGSGKGRAGALQGKSSSPAVGLPGMEESGCACKAIYDENAGNRCLFTAVLRHRRRTAVYL